MKDVRGRYVGNYVCYFDQEMLNPSSPYRIKYTILCMSGTECLCIQNVARQFNLLDLDFLDRINCFWTEFNCLS